MNELIIVNEQDEILGYGEKIDLHKRAVLHRAFSVFIYDAEQGKMLIQQRAAGKYHSGGKWSNACCSHPYKGESWEAALSRCMKDELGIPAPFAPGKSLLQTPSAARLTDPCIGNVPVVSGPAASFASSCDSAHILFTGRFHYLSRYADLSEHEMDHVFLYCPDRELLASITPDPAEISGIRWVSIPELEKWLKDQPDAFSTWFLPAYQCLKAYPGQAD